MLNLQLRGRTYVFDDVGLELYISKNWWPDHSGRLMGQFGQVKKYFHRVLLNYDGPLDVDHINGNPFDNRRENLRIVTHAENLRNRKGLQSNNKTGINGVRWRADRNKYQAYTMVNRKQINLGMFTTSEQAQEARLAFDKQYKALHG